MRFRILQDFATLELNEKSKTIWGSIWVELGGRSFPEVQWSDMSVAFLVDLLLVANEVDEGSVNLYRVRFFDGPYWVTIGGARENAIEVHANDPDEQGAATITKSEFVATVRRAATSLLEACQERGWSEYSDVRRLAANL
ncbi:hypothetical protein [Amycolatopsis orientalis]|uniref:hypothetical protein n=1 Tax=Amycolatopsis orientalis TaxID=31958 RepID=UPI0011AB7D14|nr:hypothetical protein [Amycolatopsis orientalis]